MSTAERFNPSYTTLYHCPICKAQDENVGFGFVKNEDKICESCLGKLRKLLDSPAPPDEAHVEKVFPFLAKPVAENPKDIKDVIIHEHIEENPSTYLTAGKIKKCMDEYLSRKKQELIERIEGSAWNNKDDYSRISKLINEL